MASRALPTTEEIKTAQLIRFGRSDERTHIDLLLLLLLLRLLAGLLGGLRLRGERQGRRGRELVRVNQRGHRLRRRDDVIVRWLLGLLVVRVGLLSLLRYGNGNGNGHRLIDNLLWLLVLLLVVEMLMLLRCRGGRSHGRRRRAHRRGGRLEQPRVLFAQRQRHFHLTWTQHEKCVRITSRP